MLRSNEGAIAPMVNVKQMPPANTPAMTSYYLSSSYWLKCSMTPYLETAVFGGDVDFILFPQALGLITYLLLMEDLSQ